MAGKESKTEGQRTMGAWAPHNHHVLRNSIASLHNITSELNVTKSAYSNQGKSPRMLELDSVKIKGIWWPSFVTEESLDAIKDFDVREDDVWIATWPKAGTHWVAEICQLIHQNGDLDKVDRQQEPMPLEFVPPPEDPKSGKPPRLARFKRAPAWSSPRVLVTHVPKKFLPDGILTTRKGKVITVIRNLKDSLVSYYYFHKGMAPGSEETFEEYLQKVLFSDKVRYTSWFDHVMEYWAERHNKQYLILKYEDMKADTRGAVKQIADFLERPLADEVIDKIADLVTVNNMKTRYYTSGESRTLGEGRKAKIGAPNLMRKGIVGDWKTTFTVALNETFDELYRRKMTGSSLKLEFE